MMNRVVSALRAGALKGRPSPYMGSPNGSSPHMARGIRCRYMQTAALEQEEEYDVGPMSSSEYRQEHKIKVSATCPEPYQRFEDCGFSRPVQMALERQGFPAPTPIQAQSWPLLKANSDVVSVAKTGSGKTFGFVIPAIERILANRESANYRKPGRYDVCKPSAVVLAPTRELAQQINREVSKIASKVGIRTAVLFGGASKMPQMQSLRGHPEIIVATPGRLNDFLGGEQSGFPSMIEMTDVMYAVLDEADRMLDMGFEPQIKEILDRCPPAGKRQTLMFTATWPKKVQTVAQNFTGNKVEHVMIGDANEKLTASTTIEQVVHIIRENEKNDKLKDILEQFSRNDKIIIFSGTKRMCDNIDYMLSNNGERMAGAIHGDKSQMQRDRVLTNFRQGRGNILVATDVAARGIDVPDVKAVIVYDFPANTEDYVHRIGRTGRAGKKGVAHTFLTEESASQTPELAQIMEDSGSAISPELAAIVKAQTKPMWSQRQTTRGGRPNNTKYGHGGNGGHNGYGNRGYGGNMRRDGNDSYQRGDRYGGNTRNQGYGGNDRYNNKSSYGNNQYGGNNRYGGNDRYGGNNRYNNRDWEDDYN